MNNNILEWPPQKDPELSEAAKKRIDKAFDEGSKARDLVLKTYIYGDSESQLALAAANFNYALSVLSVKAAELKAAGIRNEKLREIMREEIEGAAYSLELGDAGEHQLHDILDHEWGW
jgi:hypothetical protein